MGLERVRHNLVTEQQQQYVHITIFLIVLSLFVWVFFFYSFPPRKLHLAFVVKLNLWCRILTFCLSVKLLIGEGNGTPLQYSCLENPMDVEAW